MGAFRHKSRDTFGRRARAPIFGLFIGCWVAMALLSVQTSPLQAQQQPAPATPPAARVALDRYCVTCHNQNLKTGGLALDTLDVSRPSGNAEVWERVIQKLRAGSMPPAGRPRPDQTTYRAVASLLETEIDRAATARPNPGRNSTVHRLNRTEYQNAIRDLFALDLDVSSLLPGDETSDIGFDNNSDVLSITTAQLERYLSAARRITRLAVGLPPTAGFAIFENHVLLLQDDRQSEDAPLGSRGGISVHYNFPVDGEYLIKVRLGTNFQDYIRGMGRPHTLDIRLDGELIKRFTVGGEARGRPAPTTFSPAELGEPEWEEYLFHADEGLEVRAAVEAGPRLVSASFPREMWEPEGVLQPRMAGETLSNDEMYHGHPTVQTVAIEGPYQIAGSGHSPSRRKIFVCEPQTASDRGACATKILSRLARLAYRRPVTAADTRILLEFFEKGRNRTGSFDDGIQLALERLLVDPDFLLRIERDPTGVTPSQAYRLSDLEVASRLSFFLWSSVPDEALLDLAERRTLTTPSVLEQQVRRMLADARAQALVDNFATQWLHLRNLEDVVAEPALFPDFDRDLVDAFRSETKLFVASTLREDRSVVDLLSADYTFVNERLARHYGIPGIYGSRFRRVTNLNTRQRGGLLGHGGLLAHTSYPNRTSPVLRGKWLLDTIFGAPPPPPPPNVPALPERGEGGRVVSVRERLEQHRKDPSCASCHATIDPPGFALENFDAIGKWRSVGEGAQPIDATAVMLSGAKIDGLPGLRALLLSEPENFAGTVTGKLLSYALGRGLEYYDRPTVRRIVRDAAAREYRWSSLILGIVESPAFLMRRSQTTN